MLDGKLGVIAASRKIQSLAFEIFTDHGIPKELDPFIGIGSESTHLPVGEERRHWSAEALRRKDKEITDFELRYRNLAYDTARKVIELCSKTA